MPDLTSRKGLQEISVIARQHSSRRPVDLDAAQPPIMATPCAAISASIGDTCAEAARNAHLATERPELPARVRDRRRSGAARPADRRAGRTARRIRRSVDEALRLGRKNSRRASTRRYAAGRPRGGRAHDAAVVPRSESTNDNEALQLQQEVLLYSIAAVIEPQ
jgi:hypothetical protein